MALSSAEQNSLTRRCLAQPRTEGGSLGAPIFEISVVAVPNIKSPPTLSTTAAFSIVANNSTVPTHVSIKLISCDETSVSGWRA